MSTQKNNIDKDYSSMVSIDTNTIDLNVEYIKGKILENNRFVILDIKEVDENSFVSKNSLKEIYIKLQYLPFLSEDEDSSSSSNDDNEEINILELNVGLTPTALISALILNTYIKMDVTDEECEDILKSPFALKVATVYENFPIQDYQIHLKLLNTLSPNSLLFIDISSFLVRSGAWLKYTANFELPPSLDYLYTIHSVFDDDKEEHEYWFHTHGLNRLGLPEVEIIGLSDDEIAYPASTLLTTVAKLLIENGVPEEKDYIFEAMYDMPTILKPFSEAKSYFSESILGIERNDGDIEHPTNSFVVLPMKDGNIVSFNEYKEKFIDNPIFSLSNFETNLMREAARDTIEYFINILDSYKGDKSDEEFTFLVKLGYSEKDKKDGETEHLWFEVHSFDKENMLFDAVLINKPYYDIGLTEGEKGNYEMARLTDWVIYIEDYNYNSANIYMLFKSED